ncbi:MAG TPA: hypothetical protein VML55_14425 [Planctomycetaceae bacterium]|nr:hypothetical protein [Planctomycetaceae bacterium]
MSCRRTALGLLFVAGLVSGGSRASAQVPPTTPLPQPFAPGLGAGGPMAGDAGSRAAPQLPEAAPRIPTDAPSVFPYTPYADQPHPGEPIAPSLGQPHYDESFWRYGHWYRPKAATLTAQQRCVCPDPFRPRGFGNLFARPCAPHRMEYDPYVIIDERNEYGPSYFLRHPNQFCSSHKHWNR